MAPEPSNPSRKDFLRAMAGAAFLTQVLPSQSLSAETAAGKLLIVAAHPDDEYAMAASTYRLVRELGWTADQVVITNGEGGYRYAELAQAVYGVALTGEIDGRAHLPAIRREEAARAGKILGIRRHYFLDQKDSGFATNAAAADASNWDRARILTFLSELLARERYTAIFTLLPTPETHGHHRAATLLALEAASQIPAPRRPLVLGAEARAKDAGAVAFSGLQSQPLSNTMGSAPLVVFDRTTPFGYHNALNYQIAVNWVIAEHKSQGLFQMDSGRDQLEQFWLFEASGPGADRRASELGALLCKTRSPR